MHALEDDRPTKQKKNILGPEATQCIGPEWNRAQAAECVQAKEMVKRAKIRAPGARTQDLLSECQLS